MSGAPSNRVMLVAGILALTLLGGVLVWGLTRDYREHSTSWELKGVVDGGRTLQLSYIGGKCDSGRRTDMTETPTAVRVEVIVEVPADASCEDIAVYRTINVELARPLGDRRLLDARTERAPEFFSRP